MRPWKRISWIAFTAGTLSTLSLALGIPLTAEEAASLLLLPACRVAQGHSDDCVFWVSAAILLSTSVSLLILLRAMMRMKRFLSLPGWVTGIALYCIAYAIGIAAAITALSFLANF